LQENTPFCGFFEGDFHRLVDVVGEGSLLGRQYFQLVIVVEDEVAEGQLLSGLTGAKADCLINGSVPHRGGTDAAIFSFPPFFLLRAANSHRIVFIEYFLL